MLPRSFFPLFCFLLEFLFFRYFVDGVVNGITYHFIGYALRHLFVYEVVVLPLPITLFLFDFSTFNTERFFDSSALHVASEPEQLLVTQRNHQRV